MSGLRDATAAQAKSRAEGPRRAMGECRIAVRRDRRLPMARR